MNAQCSDDQLSIVYTSIPFWPVYHSDLSTILEHTFTGSREATR